MTTHLPADAASWPDGVLARYATLGGGFVDTVDHGSTDEEAVLRSACTGCTRIEIIFCDASSLAPQEKANAALVDARSWSQAHAESCRAVPKPGA